MNFEDWKAWLPFAPVACCSRLPDAHPRDRIAAENVLLQGIPPMVLAPTVGTAWFPVACHGWPHGGIMRVRARAVGTPDPLGVRVGAWLKDALGVDTAPHLRIEPDGSYGVELEGRSLELASLVAAVSLLFYTPPMRVPLLSGCLGKSAPGTLDSVRELVQKRAAVVRELGDRFADAGLRLVEQDASDAHPILAEFFGADWKERLVARLSLPLHQQMENARQEYQRGDWARCAASLPPADDSRLSGAPRERLYAAWLRAALATHRAEPDVLERYAEVERIVRADCPLEENLVHELQAFIGIAELDAGLIPEARARLEHTRDQLVARRAKSAYAPEPSWAWAHVSVQGSLHRVCVVQGDFPAARAALEASFRESPPQSERARILGDLVEVHRREGDLPLARERLLLAEAALAHAYAEARERTWAYQRIFRRRAGMDTDPVPAVDATLSDPAVALHLEWLAQDAPEQLDAYVRARIEAEPALGDHFAVGMLLLGVGARALRRHPTVPQPWIAARVEAFCACCPNEGLRESARAILLGECGFGERAGY